MSWITNAIANFGKKKQSITGMTSDALGHGSMFEADYTPGTGPKSFDEAMSVSAVFKCVRIIGETFGSFKAEYFSRDADGNVIPYVDHELYRLVKIEPNPLYSSMTYWETACMHVAARGNHYSYINTDQSGKIVSLDLLNPEQMIVFTYNNRIWYRDQNTNTTYSEDEIIHVKGPSKDGIMGMNPLTYVSSSFGATKEAGNYTESVYQNGAFISGILSTEKNLSLPAQALLAKTWVDKHGTSKKAGGVGVLVDGMKFTPMKVTPQDMQIIDARKYLDSDIAGLFRVPLHLVNALERSTNNNIEQQDIDFAKHCIRPYVKRFEDEYNRKLVPRDKQGTEFIRFNIDSLLRGDSKSRGEFYKTLYYIDSISPNEIRRLEKMKTRDGGDEFYSDKMAKLGIQTKNAGENGTQNKN